MVSSAPQTSRSPEAPQTGFDRFQVDWRIWAGWLAVFALISAVFPRDVHYDIAHYHLHNGWSIIEGRLDRDIAPAGLHTYLNPFHSAIIWWLVSHLPGPVVTGLLGLIQGLLLPVLYAVAARISYRLGADVDRLQLALIAFASFLTQPNWMMVATLRNDHWGALAFLTIMAILIGRDTRAVSLRTLALSALSLGLLFGMKVTNFVYVGGFAVMVLIVTTTLNDRLKAIGVCAVAGLAGMMVTGAAWHYGLWQRFHNPLFPMMEPVIGPDGDIMGTFRDTRFLASSFWDGATRPLVEAFQARPLVDYDFFGPDFLVGYLAAIASLVLVIRRAMTGSFDASTRTALLVGAGYMATFAIWTYAFSIQRYAMALWMLAPIMALMLALQIKPDLMRQLPARLGLLAACGLAIVTTDRVDLRRQPWQSVAEPYVWTHVPDSVDTAGAIIVHSGLYPTTFTAPAFEDAAWMTYADAAAWTAPALTRLQPKVRAAVTASDAPVFAVVFVDQTEDRDAALSRMARDLDLTADPARCQPLETAFDIGATHWEICPLAR